MPRSNLISYLSVFVSEVHAALQLWPTPIRMAFHQKWWVILCVPASTSQDRVWAWVQMFSPFRKTSSFQVLRLGHPKKQRHWQALVTCETLWMGRRVPEQDQHEYLKYGHIVFSKSVQAGSANALSRCELFLSAGIWRQSRPCKSHWYGSCRPCRQAGDKQVGWDCTDEVS